MSTKTILIAAILLLLGLNFYVIDHFDLNLSRWSRLISTATFFIILLFQKSERKLLPFAFFLLMLSDILLFFYENTLLNMLTFVLRSSAYIAMVLTVAPELKKLKTSILQKIIFLGALGLNMYMLFVLVDMVPEEYAYPHLDLLFYFYGIAMILMVIASISYSNRYSSRTSFFYTSATLCLVFADISSFIAYYLEFQHFYFPDRFFYILGLAGLVRFVSFNESHESLPELESL